MRVRMQFRLGCPEKMCETSVKIIKNEVRCRDDTVPKTVDTRKHCKVGLRACNNLPQPSPYIFVFRGCGRLLHALNPTLQCFLVSTVFGTVSSLHLTSFFMIFTLVYIGWCVEKYPVYRGVLYSECPLSEVPLYITVYTCS